MGNVNDNPLFHLLGTRQDQIIIARLRMRFSDLKGHLYSMKIIESSACSCGFKNEDDIHFILACPLLLLTKSHTSKCPRTQSTFYSNNIIVRK